MSDGEHIPGKDLDGIVCPRCECPEVPIVREREQVLVSRKRQRVTVITRTRACQNHRCMAIFRTVERIPEQ